jgi:hypothetical protein
MPEPDFGKLRSALLASGIRPRIATRFIAELRDHLDDLEADALSAGSTPAEAKAQALERIGSFAVIAEEMSRRSALKSWPYRYPAVARIWYPFAYVTLLPVAPIFYGAARAPIIGRWIACTMLGAAVTASMLLILQLSILFL